MIFTDNEIRQESFLEYINSFLSTGEIPGLFASDQRDTAINEMRHEVQAVAEGLKQDPKLANRYAKVHKSKALVGGLLGGGLAAAGGAYAVDQSTGSNYFGSGRKAIEDAAAGK